MELLRNRTQILNYGRTSVSRTTSLKVKSQVDYFYHEESQWKEISWNMSFFDGFTLVKTQDY